MSIEPVDAGISPILASLRRLDRRLAAAAAMVPSVYGSDAASRGFRGLYIGAADVISALERGPGVPVFAPAPDDSSVDEADATSTTSRSSHLVRAYSLTPFDLDLIMIALAPDIDLRYERLYGYLQDDVTRRRPTVDLALNLLCGSPAEKLARLSHFGPTAPLIAEDLIRLVRDPSHVDPSLLGCYLRLDEQIVAYLAGWDDLDPRIAHFSSWLAAGDFASIDLASVEPLTGALKRLTDPAVPHTLYFERQDPTSGRAAAAMLARKLGVSLLFVDLASALATPGDWKRLLRIVVREAWFRRAVLYLDDVDALRENQRSQEYIDLVEAASRHNGVTVLAGTVPWVPVARVPLPVVTMRLQLPSFEARRACWRVNLEGAGLPAPDDAVEGLSERFRLTPTQIRTAVLTVRDAGRLAAPLGSSDAVASLFAAARAQSGQALAALTQRIEPRARWTDLVLPDDVVTQLRELAARHTGRSRVLDKWGFDQKLSRGKGCTALFAGASGTGKTMAAEVIASELGLDLYCIDLASVVSKYIGETEKNLDRIFRAAEQANGILFFDEADALFGKRSEVRDSHDRYANIEVSYLLQKMEQYDGMAILATNLRHHLDDALVRRLAFTIHFPFPDAGLRRQIWQRVWPDALPLAADIDLDFLAAQFKTSGGLIKNIALASAFLAASDGGVVTMDHLRHATKREYQKLGKILSAAEIAGSVGE